MDENNNPTDRQYKVLQTLLKFKKQNGYFPSMEEIAQLVGISKQGVNGHIKALEKKGILYKVPGISRAFIIAPQKEEEEEV